MKCEWHLCKNEITGRATKYCSTNCKNKAATTRHRKELKLRAIEYKGGSCQLCGYNRTVEALEFHHIKPEDKAFGIAEKGLSRPWAEIQAELDKCILVCANCHREIEAGVTKL